MIVPCKSIVFIFLLQSAEVFSVDPFLGIAAGAADIAVDQYGREITPANLNVVPNAVRTGLAWDSDDVSAVALGAYFSILHSVSSLFLTHSHR